SCSTCHVVQAGQPAGGRIDPGYNLYDTVHRGSWWGGDKIKLLDAINYCLNEFMGGGPLAATDDAARELFEYLDQNSPTKAPTSPPTSGCDGREGPLRHGGLGLSRLVREGVPEAQAEGFRSAPLSRGVLPDRRDQLDLLPPGHLQGGTVVGKARRGPSRLPLHREALQAVHPRARAGLDQGGGQGGPRRIRRIARVREARGRAPPVPLVVPQRRGEPRVVARSHQGLRRVSPRRRSARSEEHTS